MSFDPGATVNDQNNMWLRAQMIGDLSHVKAMSQEELSHVFEIRQLGKLYDDRRETEKNVLSSLRNQLLYRKNYIKALDSLMKIALENENVESPFWKEIRAIIEAEE